MVVVASWAQSELFLAKLPTANYPYIWSQEFDRVSVHEAHDEADWEEEGWEEIDPDLLDDAADPLRQRPVLSIPEHSSPVLGCVGFLLLVVIGLIWGFAFTLILTFDS